jgi:hypothetical protein
VRSTCVKNCNCMDNCVNADGKCRYVSTYLFVQMSAYIRKFVCVCVCKCPHIYVYMFAFSDMVIGCIFIHMRSNSYYHHVLHSRHSKSGLKLLKSNFNEIVTKSVNEN